ncbi:MAG: hypothetical protein UU95_C0006G0004 [Parcubacteria group bacterium GW2011_GWC2_42_12]|nr:MAG: hypothetical protein UU95_C0006G0004 [Parcubacteria group bacterium GW2011_GWC2_42_12]
MAVAEKLAGIEGGVMSGVETATLLIVRAMVEVALFPARSRATAERT